jgi:hypothetical protein
MADLIINGSDAATMGVSMGDGFIENLLMPSPSKDIIENSSRLEHGKRVVYENLKVDERDVTLAFNIFGNSIASFISNLTLFTAELEGVQISIQVPEVNNDIYHLVYKNCTSINRVSNSCSMVVKFNEPNPKNRS